MRRSGFKNKYHQMIRLSALVGLLLACEPQTTEQRSILSTSSSDTGEESAEIPENIAGAYLICSFTSQEANFSEEEVGCTTNIDGNRTPPANFTTEFNWSIEGFDADTSIQPQNTSAEWDVIFKFSSATDRNILNTELLETIIIFDYKVANNNQDQRAQDTLANILKRLEDVRYMRLAINSISLQSAGDEVPFKKFEILVNGQWYPILFDPISITPENPNGSLSLGSFDNSIGSAQIQYETEPSETEQRNTLELLIWSIAGQEGTDILFPGVFQQPDLVNKPTSFQSSPPHDTATEPVYMIFTLNEASNIQGLRLGDPESSDQINVSGAADQIHLESSSDGLNWNYISGSDFSQEQFLNIIDLIWSGTNN